MRSRAGAVVLVGSGEFTPAMREVDSRLIRDHGPDVVLLATAAAPDGERVYADWAAAGLRHVADVGGRADALPVRTRADACDPAMAARVEEADVVYLSGGKPHHLRDVLHDTPLWRAIMATWRRGAAVAGSSAGAEVLTVLAYDVERAGLPSGPGLGLVPHVVVMPHYDLWSACRPELAATVRARAPEATFVGIDEDTALVGGLESWHVAGAGRVVVVAAGRERRYRAGDDVHLPLPRSSPAPRDRAAPRAAEAGAHG